MYEFDFTAKVNKIGERHSQRTVKTTVRSETKMTAYIDHRKLFRKKGEEVYVVVGLEVFRLKFGKIRVPLTQDELWELERKAEKMANITK